MDGNWSVHLSDVVGDPSVIGTPIYADARTITFYVVSRLLFIFGFIACAFHLALSRRRMAMQGAKTRSACV